MPARFLATAAAAEALPPAPPMSHDSDVVVVLAALLCAVICVAGLALIARCVWLRRNQPAATVTAAVLRPPPSASSAKGVNATVLLSIPTLSYQQAGAKMSSDCAICLAEFAAGDEIRVLPQCGHGFHSGCVDVWLRSHSSCPSCRRILLMPAARCQRCAAAGMVAPAVTATATVEEEEELEENEERKATGDGSASGGLPP